MYYRNAQSALVVYDVTKPTSFIKARHWVNELKAQANKNIIIALVGNKVDLVKGGNKVDKKKLKGLNENENADESMNVTAGDDQDDGSENEAEDDEDSGLLTRKVAREEGEALAKAEGLLFFETSAKSGKNVSDVFLSIANKIPEETGPNGRNSARGTGPGADGIADVESGRDGRVDLMAGNGRSGAQSCNC